jgi:hypothetical protein
MAPEGGAVELSWALRDQTNGFVACGNREADPLEYGKVIYMRLDWSVEKSDGSGGTVTETSFDSWPCNNNDERHGVTEFEVPTGLANLTVTPLCNRREDGADVAADPISYRAPPPIRREVKRGEIVTLGAVVVEIDQKKICPSPDLLQLPSKEFPRSASGHSGLHLSR